MIITTGKGSRSSVGQSAYDGVAKGIVSAAGTL